jgi:hypothetical protein
MPDFYQSVGVENGEGRRPVVRVEELLPGREGYANLGPRGCRPHLRLVDLYTQVAGRVLPDPDLVAESVRLHDDGLEGPQSVGDPEDGL